MDRIRKHNREIIASAQFRANEMKTWPSPLEEKMQRLLDRYGIEYEFQKIFYIYACDGWITRYYIADFYLPKSSTIIEVDGKFHDKQKQHDKTRTKTIQENYPSVQVLRFTWPDFSDDKKVKELLSKI